MYHSAGAPWRSRSHLCNQGNIIRKAIRHQLTNLEPSQTSIVALITFDVSILAIKRIECKKLFLLS